MKKAILLLSMFLSACGPVRWMPEEVALDKIYNKPYDKKEYNCVHQALISHRYLQAKGIKSRIVSGYMVDTYFMHAWTEAYNEEHEDWFLVDSPIIEYENTGFLASGYTWREPWFIYNADVSYDDIKNRRNISKVYWENLPEDYVDVILKKIIEYERTKNNF